MTHELFTKLVEFVMLLGVVFGLFGLARAIDKVTRKENDGE